MNYFEKYTGFFRSLKLTYILNNLLNYSNLKKNESLYKKLGVKKKVWQPISSKDFIENNSEMPWLDRENAMELLLNSNQYNEFDETHKLKLKQWVENGFLVLENFFDGKLIDNVNEEVEQLIKEGKLGFNFTGRKIMFAHKQSAAVDKLFRDKKLIELFEFILGKKVKPFQTINFIYGSEQKAHSDSIHMSTQPPGYLIAAWIALEDIKEGSGELHYYSGSQKLSYIMSDDFQSGNTYFTIGKDFYKRYEEEIKKRIEKSKIQKQTFLAKKGDVLIWHANLLHGGEPVINKTLTRKSQVCHYFAEDVICYHEITQRPAVIS